VHCDTRHEDQDSSRWRLTFTRTRAKDMPPAGPLSEMDEDRCGRVGGVAECGSGYLLDRSPRGLRQNLPAAQGQAELRSVAPRALPTRQNLT